MPRKSLKNRVDATLVVYCWRYLGEFFKKIFNGCRDFFSLTPANIGMAYAKYRANEHKVKLACLYRVQPIFKY